MKNIYFFLCLLMGMAVQAQIKIGDNPQNIDPSSVLELESSSRVLVITRVNTAQMTAITPAAGALVYNTDVQCIHYYTGTEWKDICDAVAGSITFTSDDGTVVITSTGSNNYDLMVGQITGMNIVDTTIFGQDLADRSISNTKLAFNSVGNQQMRTGSISNDNLQESIVSSLEIIDGTIQPSDLQPGALDQLLATDAAGNVVWINKSELGATQADQNTITGAGTAADPIKVADTVIGDILANANNISQNSTVIAQNSLDINSNANDIAQNSTDIATNTSAIAQNSTDIAANTTAIGTKEDVANKSDDTALGNSTTLYPTQNAVKTYVDQLAVAASSLADSNIFVGNAGNVATGVPMSGDATIDNTGAVTIADLAIDSPKIALNAVGQPHLAINSVISSKILNGNVTNDKLDKANISLTGFAVPTSNLSMDSNKIVNLSDPIDDQDAANKKYVDDQIVSSNSLLNAAIFVGDATNTAQAVALSGDATIDNLGELTIADDAITTNMILNGNVSNDKLDKANISLTGFAVPTSNLSMDSNKIVNLSDPTDNQDAANKKYVDDQIGTSNALANTSIFVGDATNTAQAVALSGDATIDNLGELTIVDDAITTNMILNGNVSNDKLDKANISLTGFAVPTSNLSMDSNKIVNLSDPTDDQDAANKKYVDNQIGTSNALTNASIFVGDATNAAQAVALSGDATIDNLGELTIADDAITTNMLLNGNVTLNKIANGTVNGQMMQWNGSIWELINNITITGTLGVIGQTTINEGMQSTTLPTDRGTANQVLTTDGDGIATWTTPASPFHAISKMTVDVPASNALNVGTVVTIGPGNYTVNFTTAASSNDYVIQLTLGSGSGREIQVTAQSASNFTVLIMDSDGLATDSEWFFTVIDL